MSTTTMDREAELRAQLAQAIEDEAAAFQALQDAQLEAVSSNKTVPGKIVDALTEAQQRRTTLEGAIAAFERGQRMGEEAAARERHRAGLDVAQQAADDFKTAGRTLITDIIKAVHLSGPEFIEATQALLRASAHVPQATLTESGWQIHEGLSALRSRQPVHLLTDMVSLVAFGVSSPTQSAQVSLRGDEQRVLELIDAIAQGTVRAIRARPVH